MAKLKLEELVMEVTRCCNLECKHCFRGDAQCAFMTTRTINNLLSNVEEIDHLVLSGGEPFIAIQQMNEIADAIYKMGIKVGKLSIITNGTILNADILVALEKLQMVCEELSIKVSDDKFHRLELERTGLMDKRNSHLKILKKMFGAEEYGTPRRDVVLSIIESVGRARSLSPDIMDMINSSGDYQTFYALSDSYWFEGADLTLQRKPPYYAGQMRVRELVNIDVNGYLTDSYASYEEADSHNIDACNINIVEAIRNNADRVTWVKEKRL